MLWELRELARSLCKHRSGVCRIVTLLMWANTVRADQGCRVCTCIIKLFDAGDSYVWVLSKVY